MIRLGDLSIEEIEKRVGVEFPDELKEYMKPRRQRLAERVTKDQWHCFDIPFDLVCGDMETAKTIHSHLKDIGGKFKTPLQISLIKG